MNVRGAALGRSGLRESGDWSRWIGRRQMGSGGDRPAMDIEIDDGGRFTVARLSGELAGPDAERLVETLRDRAAGDKGAVAIDLSELQSIDSSGLAALMNLVTRARLGKGRVVLVAPTPFVAGVFNVTHLDTWFDICKSLEEAAERLEPD